MFRTLILAAVAVITVSAGAASAQDSIPMTISAKGLDLASPADAKVYYDRVRRAAAQACAGGQSDFLPSEQDLHDACIRGAIADAVAATNAPLVTALYDGRTARSQVAAK
jgi:UrcA family protein